MRRLKNLSHVRQESIGRSLSFEAPTPFNNTPFGTHIPGWGRRGWKSKRQSSAPSRRRMDSSHFTVGKNGFMHSFEEQILTSLVTVCASLQSLNLQLIRFPQEPGSLHPGVSGLQPHKRHFQRRLAHIQTCVCDVYRSWLEVLPSESYGFATESTVQTPIRARSWLRTDLFVTKENGPGREKKEVLD